MCYQQNWCVSAQKTCFSFALNDWLWTFRAFSAQINKTDNVWIFRWLNIEHFKVFLMRLLGFFIYKELVWPFSLFLKFFLWSISFNEPFKSCFPYNLLCVFFFFHTLLQFCAPAPLPVENPSSSRSKTLKTRPPASDYIVKTIWFKYLLLLTDVMNNIVSFLLLNKTKTLKK